MEKQGLSSLVLFCGCILLALLLQGCGSGGGGGVTTTATTTIATTTKATTTVTTTTVSTATTTTTSTPSTQAFTCETNLYFDESNVANTDIKGFSVDDQTMSGCSDRVLMMWPHTNTRVKSLRLFASWKSAWGDDTKRNASWTKFLNAVNANDVKILFGVDSAYDSGENEKQFQWALQMMKLVKNRNQILGISFGNEMDFKPGINPDQFVSWVTAKVKQMDDAGFKEVKITMVWGMSVVNHLNSRDFPLLNNMYKEFKHRWAAWITNAYSVFGGLPSGQNCKDFTANAISLKYLKNLATAFRKAVNGYTKKTDEPMWIGETGWSSPCVQGQSNVATYCKEWCSTDTLRDYYQMFLQWDGTLDEGLKGVDYMFYFSNRDHQDFRKNNEGFGLVNSCSNPKCKIQKSIVNTNDTNPAIIAV